MIEIYLQASFERPFSLLVENSNASLNASSCEIAPGGSDNW